MATINGYYIFVEKEDVKRGVELSSHPVEKGLDITDNVKRSPIVISISGEIVGRDAAAMLSRLQTWHQSGRAVKYIGRNVISDALITRFDTGHPNTIHGGCSFDMEITEVRIAQSAWVKTPATTSTKKNTPATKKPTKAGTQQVKSNTSSNAADNKRYHTVKKGDCLWAIAKFYYGNGNQFKKIYEANKSIIGKNYLILAGQKLLIP